jgi:KaiC/GvpD/RAD55 family RecA-like ATPase
VPGATVKRVTAAAAGPSGPGVQVPPALAGRSATFVTQHDLRRAKEDALLQLRIGRTAHYYSLVLYPLLFIDAFLVAYGALPAATSTGSPPIASLAFLIAPLAGTLLLGLFGLLVKWEEYQLWPWERHFSVSVASAIGAALLVFLFVARVAQAGPTGGWELLPWFYPSVLAGSSAALIGLTLTWPEWSRRKMLALGAAIVPTGLGLLTYLPQAGTHSAVLALTLVASGGLFLFSGSLLHFISSGTEAHEQELINTGQSRLFQLSEETRRQTEALQFRESTVYRREADLAVSEAAAKRKLQAVGEVEGQLKQLEADLEARSTRLREEVRTSVQKIAEAKQVDRELHDKETTLSLREDETRRWEATRSEREAALSRAEGEVSRRQLELATREKELTARQQSIPATEARLESRRQELDKRTADLARREGEAAVREADGPPSRATGGFAGGDREKQLLERESRLSTVQSTLAEQNAVLGRKARELDARESESRKLLEEAGQREQRLAARESEVTHREQELSRKSEAADQRVQKYTEAVRSAEDQTRRSEQKEAELATRIEDARRTAAILQAREATIRQRTEELVANRSELDEKERRYLERSRALEAREAEFRERRLEFETPTPGQPGAKGPVLPPRPADAVVGTFAPGSAPPRPPVRTAAELRDRVTTGVPRLDDLLGGGLPKQSHVMLIGPPFLGKELLLENFLAEGLRRGEPSILLTTLRSPAELAQEISIVLPQFKEYEQLGQVHWIDATNPAGTPSIVETKTGVRAVAKGPLDYTGILAALAVAVKRAETDSAGKPMRVAALTLSACLAHGEDRAADGFVRNFVGILKPRKAVALYAIDPATLDESRVESALARMDGAVRFREEHSKTQLQVQGLGDVASRDWVEYRATNRTLALGSFALERIR